jgi:hypothetical protein
MFCDNVYFDFDWNGKRGHVKEEGRNFEVYVDHLVLLG